MERKKNGILIAGFSLWCIIAILKPIAMIPSTAKAGKRYMLGKKLIATIMAPRMALLISRSNDRTAPTIRKI